MVLFILILLYYIPIILGIKCISLVFNYILGFSHSLKKSLLSK